MRDLRTFLRDVKNLGELKIVQGADWKFEIGAITEISGSEPNPPALLFDEIKDYPAGFRIFTNMFQTQARTALALGLPTDLRGVALVQAVREWSCRGKSFTGKGRQRASLPGTLASSAGRRQVSGHGRRGDYGRRGGWLGESGNGTGSNSC